jgi:RNA polymerase sigma-70 factor (ECF subfamily)
MKDVDVSHDTARVEVERLYRVEGARLWRAVFAWSGDSAVADDAVAEAFAQALARGDGLRHPLGWIWRVAFRVAAGELKDRRHHGGSGPDGVSFEMPESTVDLVAALRRLSPNQRGSILLHHYGGYPVKDVARILGSTAPAVRVHLSVGRKRLRALLGEDIDA